MRIWNCAAAEEWSLQFLLTMRLTPAASSSSGTTSSKKVAGKDETSGGKGSKGKEQSSGKASNTREKPSGKGSKSKGKPSGKGSQKRVSFDLPKNFLEHADTEKEPRPYTFIKKDAVCMVYWENDYFECRIKKKSKKNQVALIQYVGWNSDERVKYTRLSRGTTKMLKEARAIRDDWIRTGRRPRRRVTPPDGKPIRSPVAPSGASTPGSSDFIKAGASLLCSWEGNHFPVRVIAVYENRKKARISYTGWEGRPDHLETVAFARLRKGNTKDFQKARALVRRLSRQQVAPQPKVRKVSVKSRK